MTSRHPVSIARLGQRNTPMLVLLTALMLPAATVVSAQSLEPDVERHVLGDGVQLSCRQPQPESLDCRYRLVYGGVASSAQAELAGVQLPPPILDADPLGQDGAVLLLIDTSDPAREETVAGNVVHARELMDALPAGQRVGLASFDSNLRVLADIGASHETLIRALGDVHAVGRTTEGYRSALEAVRLLAATTAGRRTLVLFSDGLFEDRAYYHRDVVEAARAAGVVVHTLGYARSVSLSVALQTLRRLAEETGGLYSVASASAPLSSAFVDAVLAGLRGGGRVRVDLAPGILATATGGERNLRLQLLTGNGVAVAEMPVEVPAPLPAPAPAPKQVFIEVPVATPMPTPALEPAAAPEPAPAPTQATAPAVAVKPAGAETRPSATLTRHIALGAFAATLLLLVVWLVVRRRRKAPAAAATTSPMDTLAYLDTEDGSGTRYPVMSALFRIGRHSDNDLVLNDGSISRHHAQLQRHRDGSFSLRDLESLNGVLVNGEKVEERALADGDLLEIGDIALRFRAHGSSELSGEDTVILKTAMPSHPLVQGNPERRH